MTAEHGRPQEAAAADAGHIDRSWRRSELTLTRDTAAEAVLLRRGELADRIGACRQLVDAAQPDVEALAGSAGRDQAIVLLADSSGMILRAAGYASFLQRAQQVALQPGVSWAESCRGTNAIGTALAEGGPVSIHGSEHFLACNGALSCHAAPVRSPRGEVLGVLDISNDAARRLPAAAQLVRRHAQQIANRLVERAQPGRICLALHEHAHALASPARGLVVIEDERIVGANEAALRLLNASWADVLEHAAEAWLGPWKELDGAPRLLMLGSGRALHALRHAPPQPRRHRAAAPQERSVAPRPLPTLPPLAPDVAAGVTRALRALDADLSVMLLGETGVGKDVCAQHLHAGSRWRGGPFVPVNCAALPESLAEAELFGYAPGAYTGARRDGALGRLREADGGLLFLDEIGDMPLAMQARLLRVLQERVVQPLGSERRIPVSFGLVCATNRDVAQMIGAGQFRADLYYRLQDYALALPPLRARVDLRAFLCAEFARCSDTAPPPTLAEDALDALARYRWPGNYRELLAVLRVLALFEPPAGVVHAAQLPEHIAHPAPGSATPACRAPRPAGTTARPPWQREALLEAIDRAGGNMTRAAAQIGVHRSTLYRALGRVAPAPPVARSAFVGQD